MSTEQKYEKMMLGLQHLAFPIDGLQSLIELEMLEDTTKRVIAKFQSQSPFPSSSQTGPKGIFLSNLELIGFNAGRKGKLIAYLERIEKEIAAGSEQSFLELAVAALEFANRLARCVEQDKSKKLTKSVAARLSAWAVAATVNKAQVEAQRKSLIENGLDARMKQIARVNDVADTTLARRTAMRLMQQGEDFTPRQYLITKDFLPVYQLLKRHPEIFVNLVKLPVFSKRSADKWWKVAEQIFAKLTNKKPWQEWGFKLDDFHKRKKAQRNDGTPRYGTIYSDIVKSVRQAFVTLAPKA